MSDIVKGDCPKCGPNRFADVVGKHQERWSDDYDCVWEEVYYRILKCRGCGDVYFQKEVIFSENYEDILNHSSGEIETHIPSKIKYWPMPSRRELPSWKWQVAFMDGDLDNLLDELYDAIDKDLRISALILVRTVFDRTSSFLGVESSLNFEQKLKKLLDSGRIGVDEKNTLDILTNAGSAAAHRGWKPTASDLELLINTLENFLYRVLIIGHEISKLKDTVPVKKKLRNEISSQSRHEQR